MNHVGTPDDEVDSRILRQTDEEETCAESCAPQNVSFESAEPAFGEIIGQSRAWRQITQQIDIIARTNANVLVLGETGTGKELIARELHRRGRRKDKPLVRVNCACIPRELYESEFFGHARGAFTSAIRDRVGRFEAAAGGTLFLDEIGEIPAHDTGLPHGKARLKAARLESRIAKARSSCRALGRRNGIHDFNE